MKYIKLFEQWVSDNAEPIFEGGASGHMMHPFDNKDLTFNDFREMIEAGLSGQLNFEEEPTEKTDGQNLWATMKDGEVMFARNKGDSKNPMSLSQIKDKFDGHPSKLVQDTFQFAADDLAKLLLNLPKDKQESIFDNGKNFINMELIYSKNPNVVNYDRDVIQFHNVQVTDGNGNVLSVESNPAKEIPQILSQLEKNLGNTFEIIPPRAIKLQKDIDFSANKDKFLKKLAALQTRYGLSNTDSVSKYNEMWWKELIDKQFPTLEQNIKNGLLQRWAFNDKKSLNMRSLAKEVGPKDAALIKKFDKEDLKKRYKENVEPFEDIFLELGSVILKNASNFLAANPTEEAKRLRTQIETEGSKIKKTGGVDQIKKVEGELARLGRIGGIESIYPTEGIVFKYKGKIYKLTGTFAAINQLLGIIKYGR
tara:strand:- start:4060 stop:5328 length:1269 start_codon:yes stop_codon:yes gene_type:complete